MTHGEFSHLLHSIDALSPEQMEVLSRELANRLAAAQRKPTGQGFIGPMREADAADERDGAAEHATKLRHGSVAKPIWERIEERTATIPDEEFDKLPTDLAEQHDHYLYGTPKRPAQ